MAELITDIEGAGEVLQTYRRVAVLGAHFERSRAAFYVPQHMHRHGWQVYPVNPRLLGHELWGHGVVASLPEVEAAVDVVNVYRRSEFLPGHTDDILAMSPRPSVVWLQLGVVHAEFEQDLLEAGIDVVSDRCMLADHRRLGL